MDPKFDPFEDRSVQQTISKEFHETHPPIHSTAHAPGKCRWSIPPSSRYWTDSTFDLKMVYRIMKRVDGKEFKLEANDVVAPINLFLSSAFSNCSILLNGVLVETYSNGLYPYCAYVKELMSKPQGYKSEILSSSSGWFMDSGINYDTMDDTNTGFTMRKKEAALSKTITLQGPLCTDLSSCKQALSPGIAIDVHLDHANDRFRLHGTVETDKRIEYYAELVSIHLVLKRYLLR